MKNKRGFTLVEVLLAAMIVGLIGVALSALTTAAIRESGIGRTRMILRNQLSLAMRQLRQDIHESTDADIQNGGETLKLYQNQRKEAGDPVKLGPDHQVKTITYTYSGGNPYGTITRQVTGGSSEIWLSSVKKISEGNFASPSFRAIDLGGGSLDAYNSNAILQVQIIVERNTNPVVNEAVEETFVLPQGFSIKR